MSWITRVLKAIDRFLSRLSKTGVAVLSFLLILGIGAADYAAGGQIGFAAFFLLPIFFLTWYVNRWAGLAGSVVGAATWFLSSVSIGRLYDFSNVDTFFFWNAILRFTLFVIMVALFAMLKSSLEREQMLSRTDPLTGIFNRRYFMELADSEIEREKRYGHPFTVAYIDLDNFKEVNDTFGHNTGDRLLEIVADTMNETTRYNDVVGRLGGDEFAVLLPETEDEAGLTVLEKLRDSLARIMDENGWPVTMSIGLVTFMKAPLSAEEMINTADRVMYSVKSHGKNSIRNEVVGGPEPAPAGM